MASSWVLWWSGDAVGILTITPPPGEEALGRLRADPRTAGIPVVVLGADAPPGLVATLLGAGAREYLTKPLDVARFLEVVDELLPMAHR